MRWYINNLDGRKLSITDRHLYGQSYAQPFVYAGYYKLYSCTIDEKHVIPYSTNHQSKLLIIIFDHMISLPQSLIIFKSLSMQLIWSNSHYLTWCWIHENNICSFKGLKKLCRWEGDSRNLYCYRFIVNASIQIF